MLRMKITLVTLYLMLQRKIGYNIKVVVTSEIKIRQRLKVRPMLEKEMIELSKSQRSTMI